MRADATALEAAWRDVNAQADLILEHSTILVEQSRSERPGKWLPFSIQARSCNRKLAPQLIEYAKDRRRRFKPMGPYVASTYASISGTCPRSCPFRNNGCYAQAGSQHLIMGRLDSAARGMEPLDVTLAEAAALRKIWPRRVPRDGAQGGRDLRLHVGGDVSCTKGARALADAVESLRFRGLGAAWTYTHRWRTIPRNAWGPIQVMASVEHVDDFARAVRRGYAPALTADMITDPRPRKIRGIRMVPCPYEASPNRPTCAVCRKCLRDLTQTGEGIVFGAHGNDAPVARRRLKVLQAGREQPIW